MHHFFIAFQQKRLPEKIIKSVTVQPTSILKRG